jgi:DNA replication and repair protein RecF
MKLANLRVQNYRNHKDLTCTFSPSVTTIHGLNGTGKTSLLEAIYTICRGISFKASDTDIVRETSDWYRVDCRDDEQKTRTYLYDNRTGKKAKQYTIDNKKFARMPAQYKWPVILFTPDDLRLIDGSPARRRRYLDQLLSQLDPTYAQAVRRYERALMQRNRLLKNNATIDTLFSWDVLLSQAGAYIIAARHKYIQRINERINQQYQHIAGVDDALCVEYTANRVPSPAQLLAALQQSTERDLLIGATSVGPHRHDMIVTTRGRLASDTMSRGEIRTFILALKYIEKNLLEEQSGQKPIVLLDDVFGELDQHRQQHLLSAFSDNQVIITSTHSVGRQSRQATKIRLV